MFGSQVVVVARYQFNAAPKFHEPSESIPIIRNPLYMLVINADQMINIDVCCLPTFTRAPMTPKLVNRKYSNGLFLLVVFKNG
jgi:hypothetical protein